MEAEVTAGAICPSPIFPMNHHKRHRGTKKKEWAEKPSNRRMTCGKEREEEADLDRESLRLQGTPLPVQWVIWNPLGRNGKALGSPLLCSLPDSGLPRKGVASTPRLW